MTLMTNDLNDHFLEEGGREKRKTVGVSPFCLRDPRSGNGDPGGPAGEERERERKKN